MPASSVGAEHMVCLQIIIGIRRDDKNPSSSDSASVTIVLLLGRARLSEGSYGLYVCTDNP